MARIPTINSNAAFRTAYYRGKSAVHPALVVYAYKNHTGVTRIGITVGKKIGKAVVRNRCRRIIYEAIRHLMPSVKQGYDLVFVARNRCIPLKSTQVQQIMEDLLKKLNVMVTSDQIPQAKAARAATAKPEKTRAEKGEGAADLPVGK